MYQDAWSNEQTNDKRIEALNSESDVVVFVADANKKIMALHNFKIFRGTLIHPLRKIYCLLGGSSNAPDIEINAASLLVDCQFLTPKPEDFMDCNSTLIPA